MSGYYVENTCKWCGSSIPDHEDSFFFHKCFLKNKGGYVRSRNYEPGGKLRRVIFNNHRGDAVCSNCMSIADRNFLRHSDYLIRMGERMRDINESHWVGIVPDSQMGKSPGSVREALRPTKDLSAFDSDHPAVSPGIIMEWTPKDKITDRMEKLCDEIDKLLEDCDE